MCLDVCGHTSHHSSLTTFARRARRPEGRIPLPSRRATFAAWLFGLLVLAAVVGTLVHFSELTELGRVVHRLQPIWLVAAVALQATTYVLAATVWQLALARDGHQIRIRALVPMALAMLFANQAFPSGGLSGSAVVMRALERRRLAASTVMGALLVGLVTTYAAYLIAVVLSLVLLRLTHSAHTKLLFMAAAFGLMAVGVPALLVWYRQSIAPRFQKRLSRVPGIGPLLAALGRAPANLFNDRPLLIRAVAVQFGEILLDAATLQVVLVAIGVSVAPWKIFGSFVMASAMSRVIPVPLGLGTFEASLVAMLRLVGVPLEPALTATLVFRGFTLWLPMLPGLWFARRELWRN